MANSNRKRKLLDGMNKCIKNARSLLREAEILHANNAERRSIALAALAIEESSKVVLLTIYSHHEWESASAKTRKRLNRFLNNHDTKLTFFLDHNMAGWKTILYIRKKPHNQKKYKARAEIFQRILKSHKILVDFMVRNKVITLGDLKLRCLYVDMIPDKAVFKEPLRVPPKVVASALFLANRHLRDIVQLRDTFRRTKTDRLVDDILGYMLKDYELEKLADILKIE